MTKLHISDSLAHQLSLPLDAVTQALAWLGRRGSGKSYGSTKLAELFYDAGAQFLAIDPVGIWYGLRLGADGKSKGLDIPIFGGLHGDVPLEVGAGALIADMIVGRNVSAVLDVSQFESDMDKARFAKDFADRFFFLKKASPSAVHVFVEEAQEFIPQNTQKGEEKMLHAWQRMIRLGRNYGIGVSMISQRPQDVNKKALNQAECLFCFQLTGPQEREAVKKWISEHGLKEDLAEVLPQLKQGHAHVWSPVWLDFNAEVHIAEKRTFAAGSTPKVGSRPVKAISLEPIELEQLRKDMAATIERQKANDPGELKKKVAELTRELAKKEAAAPAKTKEVKAARPGVDVPQLNRIVQEAVQKAINTRDQEWMSSVESHSKRVEGVFADGWKKLDGQMRTVPFRPPTAITKVKVASAVDFIKKHSHEPSGGPSPVSATLAVSRPAPVEGNGQVSAAQMRIIASLAEAEALGRKQIPRAFLASLAGVSSTSGGFRNNLGALRTAGMIDYPQSDFVALTPTGREIAPVVDPPASPQEMLDRCKANVSNAQAAILDSLFRNYPTFMGREELAVTIGVSDTSGGFRNNLGALRTAGMIDYPSQGTVKLQSWVMLEE